MLNSKLYYLAIFLLQIPIKATLSEMSDTDEITIHLNKLNGDSIVLTVDANRAISELIGQVESSHKLQIVYGESILDPDKSLIEQIPWIYPVELACINYIKDRLTDVKMKMFRNYIEFEGPNHTVQIDGSDLVLMYGSIPISLLQFLATNAGCLSLDQALPGKRIVRSFDIMSSSKCQTMLDYVLSTHYDGDPLNMYVMYFGHPADMINCVKYVLNILRETYEIDERLLEYVARVDQLINGLLKQDNRDAAAQVLTLLLRSKLFVDHFTSE